MLQWRVVARDGSRAGVSDNARVMMRKGKVIAMKKTILIFGALLLCGAPSYAAVITPLTMTLSSGGTTITVTDQNVYTPGLDMSSSAGSILFVGTVGDFSISMAAGVSYPALGNSSLAVLNLSNFSVSTMTGGTLTVTFSDANYGSAASGLVLTPGTAIGVSATSTGQINNAASSSSVSVQSWVNPTNATSGPDGISVLDGTSTGTTFELSQSGVPLIYDGGLFSMYTQAVINVSAPISTTAPASVNLASEIRAVAVPEPGSLLLLSTGLFFGAVAVRGRYKRRERPN